MKLFLNIFLFGMTFILCQGNSLGQEIRKMSDGATMYLKFSEKVNDSIQVCTLCKDILMRTQCVNYIYQVKSKKYELVGLSTTQAKALLKGTDPKYISGLKTDLNSKPMYYYNQVGQSQTLIFKSSNSVLLLTTRVSGEFNTELYRKRSQSELEAIGKCLDEAEEGWSRCMNRITTTNEDRREVEELDCANALAEAKGKCGEAARGKGAYLFNFKSKIPLSTAPQGSVN